MAASHRRTRGEGAVYQIADGTWRASLVIANLLTGARARRAVRGRTRSAAVAKLEELRTAAASGAYPSGETTADYLARWLEAVKPRLRPATFRGYGQLVTGYLVPAVGRVPLTGLLPSHVETMTSGMVGRGLSATTARYARTVLRRALGDAMRDGLLTRNAAALARPPRMERVEMRTLDAGQVRALFDTTADDTYGSLFALAVTSGLRLGELLGLEWSDVDAVAGTMTVRRALARADDGGWRLAQPKTARSRRTLMLPRLAADALAVERERQAARQAAAGSVWQDRDGLVFTDALGRHLSPSVVSHAFRAAADGLGFAGVRFHDLRHTAATLALGAGVSLKVVSEMLGHAGITITADTYAHVSGDMRREAASALDRALSADTSLPSSRGAGQYGRGEVRS